MIATFAPLVAESVEDGFLRADLDAEALVELIDVVWDGMGRRSAADAFQTSYGRVARVLVQMLLDGDRLPRPAQRGPERLTARRDSDPAAEYLSGSVGYRL